MLPFDRSLRLSSISTLSPLSAFALCKCCMATPSPSGGLSRYQIPLRLIPLDASLDHLNTTKETAPISIPAARNPLKSLFSFPFKIA